VTGYRIDPPSSDGEDVMMVTLSGAATFEMIAGLLRELDARRPSRVLIDEGGLRPGLIGPAQIGQIVAEWRKASALRAARVAVLAPNPVIYGLNRMFQGLANAEGRIAVFSGRAEALAWLLQEEAGR
jgi:hypothetical protein